MDSALKPSEWARQHKDKCLESGDVDSAMVYFEMEQLWESRASDMTARQSYVSEANVITH